jgi:hypothetical protein
MPVGVLLHFRGVTLEQYDAVIETLGYLPGGPGIPSVRCHWVADVEDGIRVIDVWDSREAFEAFFSEKLVPSYRAVGALDPPEAEVLEVHNFLGGRWTGRDR